VERGKLQNPGTTKCQMIRPNRVIQFDYTEVNSISTADTLLHLLVSTFVPKMFGSRSLRKRRQCFQQNELSFVIEGGTDSGQAPLISGKVTTKSFDRGPSHRGPFLAWGYEDPETPPNCLKWDAEREDATIRDHKDLEMNGIHKIYQRFRRRPAP
jgi:hypothetical protein